MTDANILYPDFTERGLPNWMTKQFLTRGMRWGYDPDNGEPSIFCDDYAFFDGWSKAAKTKLDWSDPDTDELYFDVACEMADVALSEYLEGLP